MKPPIEFGYRRNNNKLTPKFHAHMEYEIFYFHKGQCHFLIGDKIYNLVPGDLIIMDGMTLHSAKISEHFDYIRSVIQFTPSYVDDMKQILTSNVLRPFEELRNYKLHLEGGTQREFEMMLQRLDQLHDFNDVFSRQRFRLIFTDLLLFINQLLQTPLESKREFTSDKEKNVQNIISFIEQYFTDEISLDHLEKHLHLSKYYLSKIFKEITGFTIFDYLYQRRINEAKVLFLNDRTISITDVAFQVGFKHLAHFSRMFKQKVGVSPEKYRKSFHSYNG